EWLVVEAQISLPKAGTWDVSAGLSGSSPPVTGLCGGVQGPLPMLETRASYGPIAWAYERYFFAAGEQTVRMAFAGTDLARAGIEGPFRVHASLSLGPLPLPYAGVDGPWNSTVTLFGLEPPVLGTFPPESGALRPISFYYPETLCGTTGVYRATAFDDMVEFLRYTGRFEETTPDRDADGKFDALVVRAEVEVFVGAGFDLSGILRPVGGSAQVARATGPIWLRDGTQWVDFTFLGPEIRTSGMDGRY